MLPSLQSLLVGILVLLGAVTSLEASDLQASIHSGGVYYSDLHRIGSPPFMLGFRELRYSTDSAGLTIMPDDDLKRRPQPGDRHHRCTETFIGPFSFSVPMRPVPSLVLCSIAVLFMLALSNAGLRCLRRKGFGSGSGLAPQRNGSGEDGSG